jgi:uncharacterized protein
MRGEALAAADLGWHGLDGDRRLAFRRLDERGGFPWLTASKLPELVHFTPRRDPGASGDGLPTEVVTPEGQALPVFGEALAADVGARYGAPVQMTQLKHGIFDEASISVISSSTVGEIARLAGLEADARRFRPNLVVRSDNAVPFEERDWVGRVLSFGDANTAGPVAALSVTLEDLRCSMVNLDPERAGNDPRVLKAAVRANEGNAGIYATVTRTGRLEVGQTVYLHR